MTKTIGGIALSEIKSVLLERTNGETVVVDASDLIPPKRKYTKKAETVKAEIEEPKMDCLFRFFSVPDEQIKPDPVPKKERRPYNKREPVEIPTEKCYGACNYLAKKGPTTLVIWKTGITNGERWYLCLFPTEDFKFGTHPEGGFYANPKKMVNIQVA